MSAAAKAMPVNLFPIQIEILAALVGLLAAVLLATLATAGGASSALLPPRGKPRRRKANDAQVPQRPDFEDTAPSVLSILPPNSRP